MVRSRQGSGSAVFDTSARLQEQDIPVLAYQPAGFHAPEMEVLQVSGLRARVPDRMFQVPHRYAFHLLLIVSEGTCTQFVDFEPVACVAGTVLRIRAGQTHVFGYESNWDGWLILFPPEFLASFPTAFSIMGRLAQLEIGTGSLEITPEQMHLLNALVAQMHLDTRLEAPATVRGMLLRHQLSAFLLRLHLLSDLDTREDGISPRTRERFEAFTRLLDRNFKHWHSVADYARALECSQKSLSRAALEIEGMTPKAVITARLTLEAKRILAHERTSVSSVAAKLGFGEATNFVKFFKRETGYTPAEFRFRHS